MRKEDRVSGLIGVGLSFWLIFEALKYDYMTRFAPGPGFLPFWLGVCLGLLCLYLIFDTFVRKESEEDKVKYLPGKQSLLRVGLILLYTGGFTFSLMSVGMLISVFLLTFLILFTLEGYKIFKSILFGIIFSGFVFLVFRYWLGVNLPKGWLGL